MTTLKIADREEVLRRTLEVSFGERFKKLQDSAAELYRKQVEKKHPVFCKLIADPEARPYLSSTSARRMYALVDGATVGLFTPDFGKAATLPLVRQAFRDMDNFKSMLSGDVRAPITAEDFVLTDAKLLKAYTKAWQDYSEAWDKLYHLLMGYKTREKLKEDFPELAEYLPPAPVKMQLPAVVVSDVRKDLCRVGVKTMKGCRK